MKFMNAGRAANSVSNSWTGIMPVSCLGQMNRSARKTSPGLILFITACNTLQREVCQKRRNPAAATFAWQSSAL
jgi:hypothetical protein